jgi:nitrilase
MADRLRVACVQINSSPSKAENLERVEPLVARAAATGADLVLLPEKWNGLGSHEILLDVAEALDGGETVEAMSRWARTHGVTLVGGSIAERREGRDKLANTCVVFDPDGEVAAVYRKIHMFDVEVGGVVYRESEIEEPGDGPVSCEVEGWRLGLTVCYDLRFPELYRGYRDVALIVVPSAFTAVTGAAHWHVLLKARAIENQCYVLAAAQGGTHANGRRTYGHSVLIDPWGTVVAELAEGEGVVVGEIDGARIAQVRRDLPALSHRRPA